jgi:hypothetical protein
MEGLGLMGIKNCTLSAVCGMDSKSNSGVKRSVRILKAKEGRQSGWW